jgi:hypothetical protein
MRLIPEDMALKEVRKLLDGGDEDEGGRRRFRRLSSSSFKPTVGLTWRWVGGKRFGLFGPIPRPGIFKSNHRSGSTGRKSGSTASGY